MKYLIIGGSGLISTPITRFLLEKGEEVIVYNRGKTGVRFPDGAKLLYGDRNDFAPFEREMQAAGPFDCVIDMVCFQPEQAESAVRAFSGRAEQFIFCSTVDVYSKPGVRMPYREDEPRQAISDYGRNKVRCEDIFMAAHERGDFKTTIIRPAATYGEGGKIIHTFGWSTTFLDRLRKGKPVVVHGDGNSLWVMCHVDDVARAFIAAAGNPAAFGKAYHTTGEEWLSWDQFHIIVAQALRAPSPKLVHIPSELLYRLAPERSAISMFNFQYSNVYDNSAAKNDLGFAYTIPFLEGARRTIAWLEENNQIEDSDQDPFDDRLIAAWERLCDEMATQLK
jgi:nucleoside-diphosphate-sugar epimerase